MDFVGLLQFSLKCFDLLAWPLVALVYPLCASVRAIETNSNYHMRKLVTYWVLFSLISLFELAFVRVIEWLPFWPQIKLIFVCWLVIPQFNGAYYVYKSLVHLCLSVELQAVVKWLNKPKDVVSLKPETFLAVAETFVQKNGTEALEKLIASKCKQPNIVQKDVKTVEPPEKSAAVAVKWCKEPNIAQKDVKAEEPPEKNAAAAAKWAGKKAAAAVEVQEMTEPAARKEDKLLEPPALKKVQKEWTCAVCQVTTACEADLNSHLQGQKHRATLDELKASKQAAKKSKSEQFKQRNTNTSNAGTKLSKLWCSICDIRCPGKIHMDAHLSGSKHLSQIKKMFDLCGGEQGWECGICNVRCSAESVMVGHLNGKQHLSRVEQMLNPVGGQPGFCSICNVRCSGEIDMAAHLNGGKHLSRIQEMFNTVGGQSGWDYSDGSSGWDYGGGSSGWDIGGGSLGWDNGGGSLGWDNGGGSLGWDNGGGSLGWVNGGGSLGWAYGGGSSGWDHGGGLSGWE